MKSALSCTCGVAIIIIIVSRLNREFSISVIMVEMHSGGLTVVDRRGSVTAMNHTAKTQYYIQTVVLKYTRANNCNNYVIVLWYVIDMCSRHPLI